MRIRQSAPEAIEVEGRADIIDDMVVQTSRIERTVFRIGRINQAGRLGVFAIAERRGIGVQRRGRDREGGEDADGDGLYPLSRVFHRLVCAFQSFTRVLRGFSLKQAGHLAGEARRLTHEETPRRTDAVDDVQSHASQRSDRRKIV